MHRRIVLGALLAAALLVPFGASAQKPIKVGFPIILSGPGALFGEPASKGAQMFVDEINAKGGVLGRKMELVIRDTKGQPDEAVRVAREMILKDNVDFLVGTLTSAEGPAVSVVAKENKIVFIAPIPKTDQLTAPDKLHPYVFRVASTTTIEGRSAAEIIAKWPVKRVATISPDYAYGQDVTKSFVDHLKKIAPQMEIVDQQWPKLGEPDFTAFITAQMGKKPDAAFCDVFGGDFASLVKQATPLGYFKAIQSRLVDGGEVGTVDLAQSLGADYPYGIISDAYDPVVWGEDEPAEHKAYVEHLKATMKNEYGSGWAIVGYQSIVAIAEGVKKAGGTDSDKVAKALEGLTFDTPVGKRTFNAKTHETEAGEFWSEMVKDPKVPFAVMKKAEYIDPTPLLK
jgi:branched-chain amino acid transport system substrate-binding protein